MNDETLMEMNEETLNSVLRYNRVAEKEIERQRKEIERLENEVAKKDKIVKDLERHLDYRINFGNESDISRDTLNEVYWDLQELKRGGKEVEKSDKRVYL